MATNIEQTQRTRLRYVGFDFDTIQDDFRARVLEKYQEYFNDFALSGLGMTLFDVFAWAVDTLAFYLDRRVSDSHLFTARTRRMVSILSRQLGYKMGAAVASSVDLSVSVKNPQPVNVTIPAGFKFQGPSSIAYEAAQAVTFSVADQLAGVTKLIPAYEGESFSQTFTATGTPRQVFELTKVPEDKYLAAGSVRVKLDGVPISEQKFLIKGNTDQFEVDYNGDPPTLRFGDSVVGAIPASGKTIDVTFVATSGRSGSVTADTIQAVVTPLVVMTVPIDLAINNDGSASTGDDPESLDVAKAAAGVIRKTADKAITNEDYEALAANFADSLFGRVALAKAVSARSAAEDLVVATALNDMIDVALAPVAPTTTAVTTARARLDSILVSLDGMGTDLTDIAAVTSPLVTTLTSLLATLRATQNTAQGISIDAADIQALVTSGKAAVDAVADLPLTAPITSEALSGPTKGALKAFFDQISSESATTGAAATAIQSTMGSQASGVQTAQTSLLLVGTSVAEGELLSLETARQAVIAQVGTPNSSGVYLDLASILAVVVDPTALLQTSVDAINAHLDQILASDGGANLVSVPILSRDAAGFLAPPTNGLIQALQLYLDARKEVTHSVQVVSGAAYLVYAVVNVRVGIYTGSTSALEVVVLNAVDSLLRAKKAGQALYVSDISESIRAALRTIATAVAFVDVTIQGDLPDPTDTLVVDATSLDERGNLLVAKEEVITKGTTTASVVLVTS